jgi:hypothetical protein
MISETIEVIKVDVALKQGHGTAAESTAAVEVVHCPQGCCCCPRICKVINQW